MPESRSSISRDSGSGPNDIIETRPSTSTTGPTNTNGSPQEDANPLQAVATANAVIQPHCSQSTINTENKTLEDVTEGPPDHKNCESGGTPAASAELERENTAADAAGYEDSHANTEPTGAELSTGSARSTEETPIADTALAESLGREQMLGIAEIPEYLEGLSRGTEGHLENTPMAENGSEESLTSHMMLGIAEIPEYLKDTTQNNPIDELAWNDRAQGDRTSESEDTPQEVEQTRADEADHQRSEPQEPLAFPSVSQSFEDADNDTSNPESNAKSPKHGNPVTEEYLRMQVSVLDERITKLASLRLINEVDDPDTWCLSAEDRVVQEERIMAEVRENFRPELEDLDMQRRNLGERATQEIRTNEDSAACQDLEGTDVDADTGAARFSTDTEGTPKDTSGLHSACETNASPAIGYEAEGQKDLDLDGQARKLEEKEIEKEVRRHWHLRAEMLQRDVEILDEKIDEVKNQALHGRGHPAQKPDSPERIRQSVIEEHREEMEQLRSEFDDLEFAIELETSRRLSELYREIVSESEEHELDPADFASLASEDDDLDADLEDNDEDVELDPEHGHDSDTENEDDDQAAPDLDLSSRETTDYQFAGVQGALESEGQVNDAAEPSDGRTEPVEEEARSTSSKNENPEGGGSAVIEMIRKDNVSETNVEQEIFADEENEDSGHIYHVPRRSECWGHWGHSPSIRHCGRPLDQLYGYRHSRRAHGISAKRLGIHQGN